MSVHVKAFVEATETSVDAAVGRAGDRGADDVDDPQHACALALDLQHRAERVGGLPGLGDGDVERLGVDDGRAVPELRGGLGVGGQPGDRLDELGAGDAGVVGRSAAEDLHATDRAQLARGELEAAEARGGEAMVEAATQRAPDGLGLVADLLAQVVGMTAAAVVILGEVDRDGDLVREPRVEREGAKAVGGDRRQLTVLEEDDLLGVAHEGGDVGGDEHLAVADAEDHR